MNFLYHKIKTEHFTAEWPLKCQMKYMPVMPTRNTVRMQMMTRLCHPVANALEFINCRVCIYTNFAGG